MINKNVALILPIPLLLYNISDNLYSMLYKVQTGMAISYIAAGTQSLNRAGAAYLRTLVNGGCWMQSAEGAAQTTQRSSSSSETSARRSLLVRGLWVCSFVLCLRMASQMNTKTFFAEGTPGQFEWTLTHYDVALRLKAESKSSKPENVIKLDKWWVISWKKTSWTFITWRQASQAKPADSAHFRGRFKASTRPPKTKFCV